MFSRHIYKISLFVISLLSFSLNAAIPTSGLVGSTEGSFSVSPSGSATYNIPITIPPNVGGVQPNLSLSYDSSSGNGLLGIGWQLSGLSAITRCPTTLELDGFIDGVDFDGNDQWCLDGQRLVNTGGNEYRTEIDGFSKIIHNNTSGFSVFTAQGLKMTYGHTSSSIVYAKGRGSQSEALQYALSKAEDAHGNFYSIEYVNASYANGEHYPKKISMSNGSLVLSSVVLNYDNEDRNDVISGYVAGSKYQLSKRLTSIDVMGSISSDVIRTYNLSYHEYQAPLNYSILASVQECSSEACLEMISFDLENPNLDTSFKASVELRKTDVGKNLYSSEGWYEDYVDVDGDGKADRVWLPRGNNGLELYVARSTGDGFGQAEIWLSKSEVGKNLYSNSGRHERYVDVDGDGMADRAWLPYGNDGVELYVALSTGNGFGEAEPWLRKSDVGKNIYSNNGLYERYADVDGDGLPDRVWMPKGNNGLDIYVALSTGKKFSESRPWLTKSDSKVLYSYNGYNEAVIDVNGDGMADRVWLPSNGNHELYVALSEGDKFGVPELWLTKSEVGKNLNSDGGKYESFADVNGDGLLDRVWMPKGNDGRDIYVALSTGKKFSEPRSWLSKSDVGKNLYSNEGYNESYVDINGDGMADRVWLPSNGNDNLYVALSEGDRFGDATPWLTKNEVGKNLHSNSGKYEGFADINGDGIVERVWLPKGNDGKEVYVAKLIPTSYKISDIHVLGSPSVSIAYNFLTDENEESKSYTRSENLGYPSPTLQMAMPVVSNVSTPNGIGGTNVTYYKYENYRFDIKNKRSLGFTKTIVENNKTGIRSETTYNQTYPYIGMATSVLTELMSTGQDLSKATYSGFSKKDTSGLETWFPYFTSSIEESFLLNNDLIQVGKKTVDKNVTTEFDSSNEIVKKTSVVSTFGDDGRGTFTTTTVSNYINNYADRRQGEVALVTATTTAPGTAPITRESSFAYDWTNGKLAQEMIEPNNTDPSVSRVTNYGYDTFGNRTSTVTCDGSNLYSCTVNSPGARFASVQFDSHGLFATSSTNALHQTVSTTYDARFGVVTSITDINGLTSSSTHDSLGRKESSTNALGVMATMTREWCDLSCPTVGGNLAYYKVTSQAPETPTTVVYFDQHNREIRKQSEGFDGTLIFVDTEYDSFGRVKRTSEPYFNSSNAEIYWNTPSYDGLNRKVSVSSPNQDGAYDTTSRISYNGFTTTVFDALDRSVIEVKNVIGKVVKMTDKAQNDTFYEYDALGMLTKTIDSAANEVVLQYDDRGRKKELNDPDMGIWTYSYNTFDQLVEQIDAKGQKTKMVYDVLGRMTSRIDLAGTPNAATSTWVYDTASGKGKGKLYQKTAANGDYTRYTYNNTFGQLTTTQQKIGSKVFSINTAYDSYGRANQTTYPATAAYSSGFKVKRAYNARGYLERVFKSDNSIDYWTADFMSPRGQLEAATLGNGVTDLAVHSNANGWLVSNMSFKGSADLRDVTYTFDEVGNIKTRLDLLQQNTRETFSYDELDRLIGSSISGGASGVNHTSRSYGYDSLGNITSKSDVGAYSYSGCGNRPHAVCSAGGKSYVYDANGSMVKVMAGTNVEALVGYTAFNKPNLMNKSGYSVTFNYDADRRRNYKSVLQGYSVTLQNYYVGINGNGAKLFEREVSTANGTKDIHYIYGAGNQAVATHITEGANKRTEYLHRDHLGSVALVTNDAGAAVNDAVSFDAFGQRRNANWTDSSDSSVLPPIVGNIGFTGHETISEIGLVHMNGRVYDPNLGRFLSADPLIQAPYNSQSYNRYSYVMNNPLGYIDPTGYSWLSKKWKSVKKAARKIDWKEVGRFVLRSATFGMNVGQAYAKPTQKYVRNHKWTQQAISVGAGLLDSLGCAGACSAASASYLADIHGASWQDALKAGGRAGAAAYIMYVAGGGNRGGNAYGGNWFETAAITGTAGGVGAEITGGQFSSGFQLAAAGSIVNSASKHFFGHGTKNDLAVGDPITKEAGFPIGLSGQEMNPQVGIGLSEADKLYYELFSGFDSPLGAWDGTKNWLAYNLATEHGVLQYTAKWIPGMNSMGRIHDIWSGMSASYPVPTLITNQMTIPLFMGINALGSGQIQAYRFHQRSVDYYF